MSTILVVDDMAIIRDPIAASLRLAGFRTLVASDGNEALTVTRAKRPDLILLDVAMPKMDGLVFLKHLRADPEIAKTPVILLTAVSDRKCVVTAAGMGVGEYLLKSRFRMADLLGRIQRQLDTRAGAKQQPTKSKAPQKPPTQVPSTDQGVRCAEPETRAQVAAVQRA